MHPVAAERRIVRVDEHGEMLGARRSPKRATAVAVFDKLVAFPSLLTHPNLTIEVLLLREDHIRRPQPTTTRGRTRDPGERRLVEVLDRVALRTPEDILAALPALPLEPFSTRELAAHLRCSHAAGAAHAVLPADDRDRRAGGQARPHSAARADPKRRSAAGAADAEVIGRLRVGALDRVRICGRHGPVEASELFGHRVVPQLRRVLHQLEQQRSQAPRDLR